MQRDKIGLEHIARVRAERRGEVAITGNSSGSDELLYSLLGGIDSELYTNVFSISLSELQALSSLNSDEIRDKIYSVGLGLANVSLTDARAELDADLVEDRSDPAAPDRFAQPVGDLARGSVDLGHLADLLGHRHLLEQRGNTGFNIGVRGGGQHAGHQEKPHERYSQSEDQNFSPTWNP